MADFLTAYALVIERHDSGYHNDSNGDEIYKGISRRLNPEWIGWKSIDRHHAKNMEMVLGQDVFVQEQHQNHFRETVWNEMFGDLYRHQPVANEVFDIAVNISLRDGARFLQMALNRLAPEARGHEQVTVDGKYTIGMINAMNEKRCVALLKCLNYYEFAHYETNCRAAKYTVKKMREWLTRV